MKVMYTAMQKLMESFDAYQAESQNDSITIEKLKEVISSEYLKIEKQQIIDAYEIVSMNTAEQYYNQTFNK